MGTFTSELTFGQYSYGTMVEGAYSYKTIQVGEQPSLDLILTSALDPRVTFTRASTGTYFNSTGVLSSAATDTPRFDYDPVTLAAKGLLIEEARTNLCPYSQDFSQWTKSGSMAVTADQTGPDGVSNSARTITFPAGSDWIYRSFSGAASTQYTFSIWLRGSGTIGIGIYDSVTGGSSKTVITLTPTLTRYTFTATTAAASVDFRVYIERVFSGATATSVVCFGAQLEAGAFPTSYIPTTSASVTRAADVATMTGSNFSSWFNASEGTFVADVEMTSAVAGAFIAYRARNSSGVNYTQTYLSSTGGIANVVNPTAQASFSTGNAVSGVSRKMALAFKADDFAHCLSGGSVLTDTAGTVPSDFDRLALGSDGSSSNFLNGHIKSLSYYASRLPNATLQSLTA